MADLLTNRLVVVIVLTKTITFLCLYRFPAIERGARPVDCYVPTADNRLVQYDFDRVVFEKDSEYQHVQIMHSPQYGGSLSLQVPSH